MSNRYILFIGIAAVACWAVMSLAYLKKTENANTVVSITPTPINQSGNLNQPLYQGQKYNTEFLSKFPNLGIVLLRFNTYHRINQDKVIFRIKEKNAPNWYYENTYNTDQFQPNKLFTFGFPIIGNSNNKTYLVEIESTSGTIDNAVSIDSSNQTLVVRHKYYLQELVRDKKFIVGFVGHKLVSLIKDQEFVIHSTAYLFVCFSLFIYLVTIKKEAGKWGIIGILLATLFDIFYMSESRNYIYLFIGACWIILSVIKGYANESVLGMFLVPLIISFSLQLTSESVWWHKASAWSYIMLISLVLIKYLRVKLENEQGS